MFLLAEGLQEVVKASIVGSILRNLLLVLGFSMVVGGIGRARQVFNRTAANAQATMLFLAVAALIMPAIYALVAGGGLPAVDSELVDFGSDLEELSVGVAVILGIPICGPALLAPHPPRRLQPALRGAGARGLRLERPTLDPDARDRRRGGRARLRGPGRLDLRGVGVDRAE